MLMITMVDKRWGNSKMWILARTCNKNEPPMDPNNDEALRKVDFFESHSNILRSAESRMWTALETCDKSEGRHREAKPSYHNKLIRFIARTPSCKQLFGEKWGATPMEWLYFLHYFYNFVKNINISVDVWQKWGATCTELLYFLYYFDDFDKNVNISLDVRQKWASHARNGYISDIILMCLRNMLIFHYTCDIFATNTDGGNGRVCWPPSAVLSYKVY